MFPGNPLIAKALPTQLQRQNIPEPINADERYGYRPFKVLKAYTAALTTPYLALLPVAQLCQQGFAVDAQTARGFAFIAADLLKGILHSQTLNFIQRHVGKIQP